MCVVKYGCLYNVEYPIIDVHSNFTCSVVNVQLLYNTVYRQLVQLFTDNCIWHCISLPPFLSSLPLSSILVAPGHP